MTIRAIDMGTKTRKALDIENAFGDLGATLGGSVGREYSFVNFEVLKRNLSPALGITADVVHERDVPRGRGRAREEAAARPARADREERRRHRVTACGRSSPSVPTIRTDVRRRASRGPSRASRATTSSRSTRIAGSREARRSSSSAPSRSRKRQRSRSSISAHGAAARAAPVTIPAAAAGAGRADLSGRSAGRGADQRPAVPARAAARQRRLLRAAARRRGVGWRRLRHAPQHEPPRGQGLFLRRVLDAATAEGRRVVVRGGRRADRQDQGVGRRVRQGTEGARRRAGRSRPTSSRRPSR